ncbi:hypothetical protein ABZS76_32800 [Streptomyces sp. NPDC005562]|uniref:hypothetical protein n=1 Tax=Streptomyces sp. NPDC005562 TaxID=3154890 RepID=UPI0033A41C36
MAASETCGAPHPERPGVACDRRPHDMTGFHHDGAAGAFWGAEPPPEARPVGRPGLAAMAARTTRSGRTGSAADAVTRWTKTTEESER